MRTSSTIAIAILVSTAAVAAERAAQAQPTSDTPAPSGTTEPPPPAPASPPETPPPPQPPAQPPPPPPPPPASEPPPPPPPPASPQTGASTSTSVSSADVKGIHAALGVGPSGNQFAGFGAQIKVGVRLSKEWRVFVHSIEHFHPQVSTVVVTSRNQQAETKNTEWHAVALEGVGADYFFLPKVGARASVGVGCDCLTDLGKGKNDFGYSFLLGLTFEALTLGRDDLTLTIDPYIQKTQVDPGGGASWTSDTVVGALVSVAYH